MITYLGVSVHGHGRSQNDIQTTNWMVCQSAAFGICGDSQTNYSLHYEFTTDRQIE
jgi:hypothetical protein